MTNKLKTRWAAANGQFAKMAALSRPKFCVNLQPCGSSQRQWKPPLRQAAKAGDSVVGKRKRATKLLTVSNLTKNIN